MRRDLRCHEANRWVIRFGGGVALGSQRVISRRVGVLPSGKPGLDGARVYPFAVVGSMTTDQSDGIRVLPSRQVVPGVARPRLKGNRQCRNIW